MSNEDPDNKQQENEEPQEEQSDADLMRMLAEKEGEGDDEEVPVYDLTTKKAEQKQEESEKSDSSSSISVPEDKSDEDEIKKEEKKVEEEKKIDEEIKEKAEIQIKTMQVTSEGDFGYFPEDMLPEVKSPISPQRLKSEDIDPQTDPIRAIDRYITKTRLEDHQKNINEFTEDASFSKLAVNRMTYAQYKKIMNSILTEDSKLCGKASCMVVFNSNIAIGNIQGTIRIYGFDENKFNKNPITHKEVSGKKVTCIDVNRKGTHLVAGYENGTILVWDLAAWSLIKCSTETHSSEVLNVKWIKGSELKFISSDATGKIQVNQLAKALFGYDINSTVVTKDRCIFAMCPFFPTSSHPSELDKYSPVVIAGNNGIKILITEPNSKIVWTYKSPTIPKNALPYVDWGYGPLPGDENCEHVILAIAWDRMIQLIEISDVTQPAGGNNFHENGYYECDDEIISMYWLSEGVISILTAKKQLKIVYTTSFMPGAYQVGLKSGIRKYTELEVPFIIPEEITNSVVKILKASPGDTSDQNDRISYHQTVVPYGNTLLLACENSVFCAKLYEWNEYLDEQKKVNKWKEALQICLKMYTGEFKGFAGLPEMQELREALVRPYLKVFIKEFLQHIMESGAKDAENQAAVVIGFCLSISAVNYLFEDMRFFFNEIQQDKVYIESLQPFILAGKFRRDEIPTEVLNILIEHYKGDPPALERILLNLNLKDQDLEGLSKLSLENKLFFLHIYIKTIGNNELEYINPLIVLYEELKSKKGSIFPIEKIAELKSTIENTETFMGYVMMWYIDMCFKRKKFPKRLIVDDMQISLEAWPKIVYEILDWLITGDNEVASLMNLAEIDSNCLLEVFKQLFAEHELRDIMLEPTKHLPAGKAVRNYSDLLKKLEKIMTELSEKERKSQIINDIKSSVEGEKEDTPKMLAFYKFLAFAGSQPGVLIPADNCVISAKRLAAVNKESNGNPVNRKEYEYLILSMLQNCTNLSKAQIEDLINTFSSTSYTEVLIYLRELKKDYFKCFETYLGSKDKQANLKIFTWLESANKKLEENSEPYQQLKDAIYDNLEQLVFFQ